MLLAPTNPSTSAASVPPTASLSRSVAVDLFRGLALLTNVLSVAKQGA